MNEYLEGFYGTLALIISTLFAGVTMLGGRSGGRLLKRVVAPLLFCTTTIGLSLLVGKFQWWFMTSFVAYFVSCMVGYGGNTLWEKIERRFIWSLIRSISAITFCLFTGAWVLMILQTAVGLISSILLGILNPLNAPQEETLINFLSVVFVPFMVL